MGTNISRSLSATGLLVAIGLASALLAGPAAARPSTTTPSLMPSYGVAPPPAGYLDFCLRLPAHCKGPVTEQPASSEEALRPLSQNLAGRFDWTTAFAAKAPPMNASVAPGQHAVAMSNSLWRKLDKINRTINQKIIPASDIEAFGAADYWAMPLTEGLGVKGNCKHYVVEKREALIKAGVPAEALNIAVARTPWGEVHAVLLIETQAGDYVLDSLSPWITPWNETGYTWLQRQVDGEASHWAKVA